MLLICLYVETADWTAATAASVSREQNKLTHINSYCTFVHVVMLHMMLELVA